MLVSVISIGNSKGIRLPKAVLDQLNIQDSLEMKVEDSQLILRPVQAKARKGWENAFKTMSSHKDDTLLIPKNDDTEGFDWEW